MEKRQSDRVPFLKPVVIYPVFPSYSQEGEDRALSGQSRDISGGGLGLKTAQPLKPGSFLKLRFEMGLEAVEAFGKVVWAREDCCGLSFYSPSGFLKGGIQDFRTDLSAG